LEYVGLRLASPEYASHSC